MAGKIVFVALFAFIVTVTSAHFISHPGRFSSLDEKPTPTPTPDTSSEEIETETESTRHRGHGHGREHGHGHGHDHGKEGHHEHYDWPHHGGKREHHGFPDGIKVDEKTLENLRIKIKQEMEENDSAFNFEEHYKRGPRPHHHHHHHHRHHEDEDEDFDLNWDEEESFPTGEFFDSAAKSKSWRREFGLTRILVWNKNGTKTFLKTRESTRASGDGDISITGSLNTTLQVKATGSGGFGVNMTYTMKGKDTKSIIDGDATSESTSSSKLSKDRLVSKSSVKSEVTVKDPKTEKDSDEEEINMAVGTPITITTVVNSKSETFAAPFRTYLSLFSSTINTTTKVGKDSFTTEGVLKGEVTSHVLFVKNGTSLTRVKVKAFMTSHSGDAYKQLVLIKSKTHIWAKISSKTEDGAVVDFYSSTKTRAYGKGVTAADKVYSGSGTVACEKSQITISLDDAEDLHASRAGMQIVHNGISGNAFIKSALLSTVRI